ncbi:NUDIX domain-containing protein [Candidatus Woesearchaeota archaeon]|nr:MAG: NUDIX domain-containing protein [Candidatus Woesearchaeota archaeon]
MSKINWKDKCWVTTIFLVRKDEKVLLTWNKNLQTWIPVGGHIDEGETPEEAVAREVAEETGFSFEFLTPPEFENSHQIKIIHPYRVQIENVPHHNKHINIVFFGKCISSDDAVTKTDEDEKLRWFSEKELLAEPMLEGVKKSALAAIERYKKA